jgi:hypothetical protein
LIILGLIDKEGKVTERANNWRVDDLYQHVCQQIIEEVYPPELLAATEDTLDRNFIAAWFMRRTGVGQMAAHKNAAIFEVLRQPDLSRLKEKKEQPASKGLDRTTKNFPSKPSTPIKDAVSETTTKSEDRHIGTSFSPAIHIDLQIHISPESSSEQIDIIFASIAKHLFKSRY